MDNETFERYLKLSTGWSIRVAINASEFCLRHYGYASGVYIWQRLNLMPEDAIKLSDALNEWRATLELPSDDPDPDARIPYVLTEDALAALAQ